MLRVDAYLIGIRGLNLRQPPFPLLLITRFAFLFGFGVGGCFGGLIRKTTRGLRSFLSKDSRFTGLRTLTDAPFNFGTFYR